MVESSIVICVVARIIFVVYLLPPIINHSLQSLFKSIRLHGANSNRFSVELLKWLGRRPCFFKLSATISLSVGCINSTFLSSAMSTQLQKEHCVYTPKLVEFLHTLDFLSKNILLLICPRSTSFSFHFQFFHLLLIRVILKFLTKIIMKFIITFFLWFCYFKMFWPNLSSKRLGF